MELPNAWLEARRTVPLFGGSFAGVSRLGGFDTRYLVVRGTNCLTSSRIKVWRTCFGPHIGPAVDHWMCGLGFALCLTIAVPLSLVADLHHQIRPTLHVPGETPRFPETKCLPVPSPQRLFLRGYPWDKAGQYDRRVSRGSMTARTIKTGEALPSSPRREGVLLEPGDPALTT